MQYVSPESNNILKYFVLVNIKKIFLQYDLNNSQYSFKEFQFLLEIINDYIKSLITSFDSILNRMTVSKRKRFIQEE